MARYLGPACKRCRRLGAKLYLKGERCYTDKCAMENRPTPPGEGPKKHRSKPSDYAIQLKEKQKLREMYGLLERQFVNYFEKANNREGITSQNLVDILESRLDNVVYRLGFASSRKMARQMVRNGYFSVNGKKVNIPSYQVKPEEEIKIIEKYANNQSVLSALNLAKQRGYSDWIDFVEETKSGKITRLPSTEELGLPIDLQLVVELYSK
jgi:small subunit ribosomal protein S4